MMHARSLNRALGAIALVAAVAVLGGCTNEFVMSYQGTRYPAVTDTVLVTSKPEVS